MDETARVVPPFTPALVFTDPTPNQIVLNRIARRGIEVAGKYTDLSEKEKSDFFDIIILVSHKMASVWEHFDAYCREEDRLIGLFKDEKATHLDYGQKLFREYDGFAVQIKSSFDFVVKVLRPTIGLNIHTFGKKGETVLKVLKRNTAKEREFKVRLIEAMCFTDKRKEWLTAIINSRDNVNHYQGEIKLNTFAVYRKKDGSIDVPRWSNDQMLREAMRGLWYEFFFFVEDFMFGALYFRMHDKLDLVRKPEPITSVSSPWRVVSDHIAAEMMKKLSGIQKPTVI